jgi:hypothetical protein
MPINVDDETLANLSNTFGCAIGSMPFTYLGLPLGTTRPTIQDLSPIVDHLEHRLNASARFLDYGGRLQLINSVLSILPNHYLCSLKVHKTIIKIADRSRRHCLWAKEERNDAVHSLAAWNLVCRPKKHGGLGIINFELQNNALLLKQLHKFYCKADIPWVKLVWSLYSPDSPPHAQSKRGSFWWKDVFSLIHIYRSVSMPKVVSGETILFWKDFWHNDELLCDTFPRLFSYSLNEDVSFVAIKNSADIFDLFALPISVEAHDELIQLQEIIQNIDLIQEGNDTRSFIWGNTYTASKFYNFLFSSIPCDGALKEIWKSKCLPKLRVFAWLLFMNRLNTKELMLRKHWEINDGPSCVLCNAQTLETRDHLFFECSFAADCWNKIGIHWDCSRGISDRYFQAKRFFSNPCFMEILSARLGIFGRKEMTSSSSNKFLPWLAGGFVFKVIYYFTSIESSLH